MLRLLLDEHLSPRVAQGLRKREPRIAVAAMRDWQGGAYLGAWDDTLLDAARKDGITLVTYDQKTIRPLLVRWAEQEIPHAGVIFIDNRTLRPQDVGGLVRALHALWESQGAWDWSERVVYLTA